MNLEQRAEEAVGLICEYGYIEGDHHKDWLIDQVLRLLTGCPKVTREAVDCDGKPYTYEELGESEEYLRLTRDEDGEEDGWDEGVAP